MLKFCVMFSRKICKLEGDKNEISVIQSKLQILKIPYLLTFIFVNLFSIEEFKFTINEILSQY